VSDRVDQKVDVDRFGDDCIEARIHGAVMDVGRRVSGACDGRHAAALIRGQVPHATDQFVPVFARHAEI
jgi:hypothetical protein